MSYDLETLKVISKAAAVRVVQCPGRFMWHPTPPDSCGGCGECEYCPCGERLYCNDQG